MFYPNILVAILAFAVQPASHQCHPPHKHQRQAALDPDIVTDATTTEPPPILCGQYGFRCIDDQYYQVCPLTDINGHREEPNIVHECQEDLVCDEDNNAYCSPRLQLVRMADPPERRCGEGKFKRQDVSRSNATVVFKCEGYGMFPDTYNASMFWFCDRGCHEHTFNIRHMLCAEERIFDAKRSECVPKPESVDIDQGGGRQTRQHLTEIHTAQHTPAFSCAGRPLGKYPDPDNCQKYHLCLPEKGAHSFNEIVFICPDGLAYDADREHCDRSAVERCVSNGQTEDAVTDEVRIEPKSDTGCGCDETGSRSRDDSSCDGYRLCVGRALLQMRCPHGEQFNANLLLCQPESMVKCLVN